MATTQNLLNLKIHKLSKEQFNNLENPDSSALYLIPEEEASTTTKGIVQLSNATDGTSETLAATSKAVSSALSSAKSYTDDKVANQTSASTDADGLMSKDDKVFVNKLSEFVFFDEAYGDGRIGGGDTYINYINIDTSMAIHAMGAINITSENGEVNYNGKEIATQEYVAGASVASAAKLTKASQITISDGTNTGSATNFDGSGNVTLNLPKTISATTFVATSDRRLKENLVPYSNEKSILDLPVYKYNFIADENKKANIGCLAQDLQEICPEIIDVKADGYLGIQESKIVYLLLEEVKKLKEEVSELRNNLSDNK